MIYESKEDAEDSRPQGKKHLARCSERLVRCSDVPLAPLSTHRPLFRFETEQVKGGPRELP